MLEGLVVLVGCLSWWITYRLANTKSALFLLDHPNARSLHEVPIPRTGGLAIMVSSMMGIIGATFLPIMQNVPQEVGLFGWPPLYWLVFLAAVLACVSLLDDRVGLPVLVRLGIQFSAAAVFVMGSHASIPAIHVPLFGTVVLGQIAVIVSLGLLVWMTNLYNFMDGMDGFAGGMTVVGGGVLAYLAWINGSAVLLVVAVLIGVAAGGFLVHNFPPARIFLGDVGSIPIGFVFGALMILGVRDGVFDIWVPLIVFSPFILDATVTLVRRIAHGEQVWKAHRSHFYQRAVLLGWGHRRTVLGEYVLMGICAMLAVLYQQGTELQQFAVLVGWCVTVGGAMAGVAVAERSSGRRQAVPG